MEVHSTLFLFGGFDQITRTELGQDKGHFFKYINTEVIESLFILLWLCIIYRPGV